MRRVLGVSTVIDPVHRAKAQVIVEMMPEACETMEAINDGDEEAIQSLSSDGPRRSGICGTVRGGGMRQGRGEYNLGWEPIGHESKRSPIYGTKGTSGKQHIQLKNTLAIDRRENTLENPLTIPHIQPPHIIAFHLPPILVRPSSTTSTTTSVGKRMTRKQIGKTIAIQCTSSHLIKRLYTLQYRGRLTSDMRA